VKPVEAVEAAAAEAATPAQVEEAVAARAAEVQEGAAAEGEAPAEPVMKAAVEGDEDGQEAEPRQPSPVTASQPSARAGAGGSSASLPDPTPQSPFELWLQQMKSLFSPLFYSTSADGRVSLGVQALQLPEGPLLFVGNHQLFGFDGPMILEELLRERGVMLRPLVFPPLLADTSPLAPFPYPLPGTKQTFERFGATPISPRAMYKGLAAGESLLLFPGGAREVFKRKGEEYSLFWPDDASLVRIAARCNATLIPFSGVGGESFSVAVDSAEMMELPLLGDFFKSRVAEMPSLVEDDVFVPPFGAITPQRHYFLFGSPISTSEISSDDSEAVARAYADLRGQVEGGIQRLREEVRPADSYSDLATRTAWEMLYGMQAPAPPA